jgi:mono/diheme cytochrome c family protein
MAVSNGVLAIAAVVAVVAIAAEAIVRDHEFEEMNRTIVELSTRVASIDAAVNQASSAAAQAAVKADQANATATQAKEAADRAVAAEAVTSATGPASQQGQSATVSDVAAGHDRALLICAACHVVAPDQQLAPLLRPPAPAFQAIVNRPNTTERGLHDFLLAPHGKMPNPSLMDQQVRELVAYMMTLRDQH